MTIAVLKSLQPGAQGTGRHAPVAVTGALPQPCTRPLTLPLIKGHIPSVGSWLGHKECFSQWELSENRVNATIAALSGRMPLSSTALGLCAKEADLEPGALSPVIIS